MSDDSEQNSLDEIQFTQENNEEKSEDPPLPVYKKAQKQEEVDPLDFKDADILRIKKEFDDDDLETYYQDKKKYEMDYLKKQEYNNEFLRSIQKTNYNSQQQLQHLYPLLNDPTYDHIIKSSHQFNTDQRWMDLMQNSIGDRAPYNPVIIKYKDRKIKDWQKDLLIGKEQYGELDRKTRNYKINHHIAYEIHKLDECRSKAMLDRDEKIKFTLNKYKSNLIFNPLNRSHVGIVEQKQCMYEETLVKNKQNVDYWIQKGEAMKKNNVPLKTNHKRTKSADNLCFGGISLAEIQYSHLPNPFLRRHIRKEIKHFRQDLVAKRVQINIFERKNKSKNYMDSSKGKKQRKEKIQESKKDLSENQGAIAIDISTMFNIIKNVQGAKRMHNNIVAQKEGKLTEDEILQRNIKQYKKWIDMYLPPDGVKIEFSISEKSETVQNEFEGSEHVVEKEPEKIVKFQKRQRNTNKNVQSNNRSFKNINGAKQNQGRGRFQRMGTMMNLDHNTLAQQSKTTDNFFKDELDIPARGDRKKRIQTTFQPQRGLNFTPNLDSDLFVKQETESDQETRTQKFVAKTLEKVHDIFELPKMSSTFFDYQPVLFTKYKQHVHHNSDNFEVGKFKRQLNEKLRTQDSFHNSNHPNKQLLFNAKQNKKNNTDTNFYQPKKSARNSKRRPNPNPNKPKRYSQSSYMKTRLPTKKESKQQYKKQSRRMNRQVDYRLNSPRFNNRRRVRVRRNTATAQGFRVSNRPRSPKKWCQTVLYSDRFSKFMNQDVPLLKKKRRRRKSGAGRRKQGLKRLSTVGSIAYKRNAKTNKKRNHLKNKYEKAISKLFYQKPFIKSRK